MVKWGMTAPASQPAQTGAEPAPQPGSLPTTRPLRRWQIFTHWPSLRETIVIWLPTLALVVGAFWLTYHFVQPAPPDHITMTTGAADGAYHQFALKYQRILAREGIRLDLKPSSGSVENLARLKNDSAAVDVGFVQGGLGPLGAAPATDAAETRLFSLGNLTYEGVWIFVRGKREFTRLTDLKDSRVAVGPPGSGTRKVALDLLAAHGIAADSPGLSPLGGSAAIDALKAGNLEAVFLIAAPEAPVVQELAGMPGLYPMSLANAPAIARRYPYLTSVTLAQGVFDLRANLPTHDVQMLATKANLVIREDLHPALTYLLLEAEVEVHSVPGLFNAPGEFPTPVATDYPLAEEAKRYFKTGRPFLQRYLPFWLANLAERMLVFLVPIFGVLVPVIKFLPTIVNWRRQQRINRWYGELKFLELELASRSLSPTEMAAQLKRIDEIDNQARALRMPLDFSEKVYTLRQHIDFVRGRLNAPASTDGTA